MQDHVYVQYLELNTFQSRFRELANTFANSERAVRDLPLGGNTAEEVNAALDKVETCAQSLAQDGARARELSKMGQDLLADHNFAADCVQPKCNELKMMCQKLEHMVSCNKLPALKKVSLPYTHINNVCTCTINMIATKNQDRKIINCHG